MNSLATHRINARKVRIYSKYGRNKCFFIKKWRFGKKLKIKKQILWSDRRPRYKTFYGTPDGDCVNLRGVSGQGNNPEPPELFWDHALVLYDGDIYDPSYGLGPYKYNETGKNNYENAAIDGYSDYHIYYNPGVDTCKKNNPNARELEWTLE